jgi:hypothetical protein
MRNPIFCGQQDLMEVGRDLLTFPTLVEPPFVCSIGQVAGHFVQPQPG